MSVYLVLIVIRLPQRGCQPRGHIKCARPRPRAA
jgi:hypothetical protein